MSRNHKYLINGNFNQSISPFDRGFSYGDGVFRTFKMVNGIPQHWPQHYQKLVADCAVIGIVCPSAELLMADLQEIFSPDEIAVAKVIITRGEGERGYAPPSVTSPLRVVIKTAMPQYAIENYENGVCLYVCEIRLSQQPKLAGIKHLNRLENIIARMEWHDESIFDGLLLDQQSNVIECTMSNIFARFGDQLITPDLSQSGVAGITRQRIIELSSTINLKADVAKLTLNRLLQADEVFICNSLYGTFQVKQISSKEWPKQKLATTFRNLLSHE